MINVAVMGYGTIGSGVVEVLQTNQASIAKKVGDTVNVKYVLDLRDFAGDPVEKLIVHDYKKIAEDPEVSIVVETMGGVEPAFTFVREMLEHGKSVTTSNKALVAEKGAELLALAKEKNVNFQFEASVGGGIPIIRPLNTSLAADLVDEITGIVNGTTNYMLTKMATEGVSFEEVLKDAQEKGFAEKDPTNDVEGFDASRKIAILTSIAAGRQVDFQDIHTEGITKITARDMEYAKVLGSKIKLLASSKRVDDSYLALVAPFMVKEEQSLYAVDGVFNAITVVGNMLGEAMFYGMGAGKLPTASAVASDVVDMARHPKTDNPIVWETEKLELVDFSQNKNAFFVRSKDTRDHVLQVFGAVDFVDFPSVTDEVAFVTEEMTEAKFEMKKEMISLIQAIRVKA